ncbi:MAG: hypothetical protein ABI151_09385 [Chitinophagaceae bacterium]
MSTSTMIILAVSLIGGIMAIYLFTYFSEKSALKAEAVARPGKASLPLQLQAYERLVLLAERISLPNLVSRINQPELTARQMQQLLTMSIRQEFEHNITQQIYVSRESWEAVTNLKEQNLLIINQVASFLPDTATGGELNKSLMELLMQNPDASLHKIVSEALQFEAKRLMI